LNKNLFAPVAEKKRVPDGLPVRIAGINLLISHRRIYSTRIPIMNQNTGIITGAVPLACTEVTNGEKGFWAGFFHPELLRKK
jgi:hypothetical protein